jgi:hypothetical protein
MSTYGYARTGPAARRIGTSAVWEATMNQPWPLKGLNLLKEDTTVIPFLLSGFAFAYVIGYFLAFDLAWLPFFSLSEHIVFAIRALPFAVAALVALLFAKEFPQLMNRAILVWLGILWLGAATALVSRYFGLSVSFAIIAVATHVYLTKYKDKPDDITMPYLAAQLVFVSLIIGYLSGTFLKFDGLVDDAVPHWLSRSMHVHVHTPKGPSERTNGHVVFVGDKHILFYNYGIKRVQLYQWTDVDEVHESDTD